MAMNSYKNVLYNFIRMYIKKRVKIMANVLMVMFVYKIIVENNVQCTFSNIEIVLHIYLVLIVFNCSEKRSFSKIKLQTSMRQS